MTTRHNHGKRPTTTSNLFALANVLFSFANFGAHILGNQERGKMEQLKAENLRLKNQAEFLRQGTHSNKVVEGDLRIELLQLKIEAEKRKLGIVDDPFKADNYTDPGNVSRYNLK